MDREMAQIERMVAMMNVVLSFKLEEKWQKKQIACTRGKPEPKE